MARPDVRVRRQAAGARQGELAAAMVLAGLYVVVEGLRALIDGSHAEESAFGIVLAALSIAVLPRLEDALLGIKPPDADLVSAARADFAPLLFSDEIANDTRREP